MLNSDIFSAAFAGHPFVAVVCDNEGFAVIHRLQTGQGARGFNNRFADAKGPGAVDAPVRVDFVAHARALGATAIDARDARTNDELAAAYARAREAARTTGKPVVLVCRVHENAWTEVGAWWEVGVPAYLSGRAAYEEAKVRQLRWAEVGPEE